MSSAIRYRWGHWFESSTDHPKPPAKGGFFVCLQDVAGILFDIVLAHALASAFPWPGARRGDYGWTQAGPLGADNGICVGSYVGEYLHFAFDFAQTFEYNQHKAASVATYVYRRGKNAMEYMTTTEAAEKWGGRIFLFFILTIHIFRRT